MKNILFKKWKEIGFSGQHIPHKNKKKNSGMVNTEKLPVKAAAKKETHHVWPKPFRNNACVCRKNDTKSTDPEEHDAWNKMTGKVHPEIAFKHIAGLCSGRIKASEEEKEYLKILAGFDWQKNPNVAIVAIFEKFMPDELGAMLKPYLDKIK